MDDACLLYGFAAPVRVALAPVDTLADRITATIEAHAAEHGAPDAVLAVTPAGVLAAWPLDPPGYARAGSRHGVDVRIVWRRAA